MTRDAHGLKHHHEVKNIPKPTSYKKFLDKAVYVFGVIGPLLTIPQLLKIWIQQSAQGVSLITWGTYLILSIVWLLYGIEHKQKPIILMYTLWLILDILIVIGILMYGTGY